MPAVHHLLLAGALALLLGAGLRVSSRLSAGALERSVAAAAFAAAMATIQALALGLFDLGTSSVALFLGALAVWVTARRLIPAPGVSLGGQLAGAWDGLSPRGRFAAGALAGAGLAWTVWLLRYPAYDWDSLNYHIPEVIAWVQNGSPGSIVEVVPGWPYANLPVVNEVLLSWGSGLARSFVWITIWPSLMLALLAASGWLGLRALRVPVLPAALATTGLCAAPMATSYQANGANTDLPALAWLVAAGALCAASARDERTELLVPALLAAALAVGTKTTVAPLAVIAVGIAVYRSRAHLRPLRVPLMLAAGGALVIGGTWYLRDVIEHGSPTWPYFALPWGDAAPHLAHTDHTFFARPLKTLGHFGDTGYVRDTFLGGLLVLASAVSAAVVQRRRVVAIGAAATGLSVFLWTLGPDTGAPSPDFNYQAAFYGSPRLLMPGVAVATLTVAVAARDAGRRGARLWTGVLGLALLLNVVQLFDLGFPRTPSVATPLVGALLVGLLALAAGRLPWRAVMRPIGAAVGVLTLGAALALAASGFVNRHAHVGSDPRVAYGDAALIRWFAGAGGDGRPIYSAPLTVVMLAGDDLGRKVAPIPRRAPCQAFAAHAREGWVVIQKFSTDPLFGPSTTRACVASWRPVSEDPDNWIYDARSLT
ncbi:MAG TPA: hypothetical protein VGY97_04285 [Solirubrobacteraceae bacterium]|nr:hypothetical protein [Solirubrobacteraceae bacterium]